MRKDPAIEEIRSVCSKISAKFGHNTNALLTHYKQLEARFEGRILRETEPFVNSQAKILTPEKTQ